MTLPTRSGSTPNEFDMTNALLKSPTISSHVKMRRPRLRASLNRGSTSIPRTLCPMQPSSAKMMSRSMNFRISLWTSSVSEVPYQRCILIIHRRVSNLLTDISEVVMSVCHPCSRVTVSETLFKLSLHQLSHSSLGHQSSSKL